MLLFYGKYIILYLRLEILSIERRMIKVIFCIGERKPRLHINISLN